MGDSTEFLVRSEPKARWSDVSRLVAEQEGVISREQLRGAGFTDNEIKALIRRGLLIPLHRGVFAVGHRRLSTRAHLVAALLAAGRQSFLSHRTAAAVYGLRDVAIRRIDVTVPGGKRRSRGPLRIHTTATEPDVKTRNGLRVSSVPQMLIELAPDESERALNHLITQAVRRQVLDLEKMRLALARHGRRPGVAKLERALAGYLPTEDRRSDLERDFDAFLREHPEIPVPRRNIMIDGWEIDCYWPEQRLAVELDGRPYHVAIRDIEKDKFKDAKLLLRAIRTLRITDTRFNHDRSGVYEDLLSLTKP
jgi:very-short-patch-repair endonuclease